MRAIYLTIFTLTVMTGLSFAGDKAKSESLALDISTTAERDVEVKVLNRSASSVNFWQDSNSWGIAHWRILVLNHKKLVTLYQENGDILSLDTPSFTEIPAGKSQTIHLNLNESLWRGDGLGRIVLRSGDVITVILDVPRSTEGDKLNVWHGVIAAVSTVK